MNDSRIVERLRYSLRKNEVLNLSEIFSEQPNGVKQLLDLTQNPNGTLAFHSAWVLEHILTNNHKLLREWFAPVASALPSTKNISVQRLYAKIVNYAMEHGLALNPASAEPIAEMCFERLLDAQTPVAVKAHCMDILMRLTPGSKWIRDELPHVIRLNLIDATPGIASKSRKILAKLHADETP